MPTTEEIREIAACGTVLYECGVCGWTHESRESALLCIEGGCVFELLRDVQRRLGLAEAH